MSSAAQPLVRSPRKLLASLAAATALLLGGCAVGGGGSDSSSPGAPVVGSEPAQDASGRAGGGSGSSGGSSGSGGVSDEDAAAKGGSGSGGSVVAAATGQKLSRNASISMEVKDIAKAASAVRALALRNRGVVLSEHIGGGDSPWLVPEGGRVTASTYGEITISVPAAELDSTLDELSRLGTVIGRTTSTEDVTSQYVDTESRIKTMRASLERVRALMSRTTDIGQIVTLEAELSRRQADLESLESQLASLKLAVERSPIQVSLTTDPDLVAPTDDTGFLAGLAAGWRAFTKSMVWALTVAGALLPFLVLAALIALPLFWWARRHRHAPTAQPAAAPAATPAAGPSA